MDIRITRESIERREILVTYPFRSFEFPDADTLNDAIPDWTKHPYSVTIQELRVDVHLSVNLAKFVSEDVWDGVKNNPRRGDVWEEVQYLVAIELLKAKVLRLHEEVVRCLLEGEKKRLDKNNIGVKENV